MCPTLSGNLQGSSLEHSEDYGEKNRHKVTLRLKTTEALTEKKDQRKYLLFESNKTMGLVVLLLFEAAQLPGRRKQNKTHKHCSLELFSWSTLMWFTIRYHCTETYRPYKL